MLSELAERNIIEKMWLHVGMILNENHPYMEPQTVDKPVVEQVLRSRFSRCAPGGARFQRV